MFGLITSEDLIKGHMNFIKKLEEKSKAWDKKADQLDKKHGVLLHRDMSMIDKLYELADNIGRRLRERRERIYAESLRAEHEAYKCEKLAVNFSKLMEY